MNANKVKSKKWKIRDVRGLEGRSASGRNADESESEPSVKPILDSGKIDGIARMLGSMNPNRPLHDQRQLQRAGGTPALRTADASCGRQLVRERLRLRRIWRRRIASGFCLGNTADYRCRRSLGSCRV